MNSKRFFCLSAILFFGQVFPGTQVSLHAAEPLRDPSREQVQFETADGINLRGTFYPGNRGRKSPAVLLLHDVGDDRAQQGWESLARELQRAGLAVLTFDFRGHGRSTEVGEFFWQVPWNRQFVRGYRNGNSRNTVSFSNFNPAYYPMLVNDICAARVFLDQKNDASACNSSNLVVVGVGEGATLGALWVALESYRFSALGNGFAEHPVGHPAGQDVTCAVWLGIDSYLAGRRVPVLKAMEHFSGELNLPVGFLYNEENIASAEFAKHSCEVLRKKRHDLRWTAAQGVRDSGLGHAAPCYPSGDTEKMIKNYVVRVLKARGDVPWASQNLTEEANYWVFPGIPPQLAKLAGERHFRLVPLQGFLALR